MPAVADLDLDPNGDLEIVGSFFYIREPPEDIPPDQVFIWQHDGTLSHQFTTGQDMIHTYHPCLADINGDGDLEIIVSEADFYSHTHTEIFHLDGTVDELPYGSWNVTPAVGNLTGGTETEIVLGHENKVYCFYWTGTGFEERWRVETGGAVASSPAVADFDRELPIQLDVMFGSNDWKIYAVRGDFGTPISPEWPSELPQGPVRQSPAMVRVDAEDGPELLIGSDDWNIYLLNKTGNPINPFPLPLWGKPRSAVCGDINNDGIQEAVFWSDDGYLHIWKLPTPEGIANPGLDWPTFHHDPARTGYYEEP
ncbi:hypothetical protein DRP53_10750 [candidate division WOR-3 bacterium]|uniref:Uncharacterized protein n=1 Tax=candidate division WOR-3 bacterium TaxID=2052148 RepID=A0A660SCF8_UNCW3|nr:MAG: hypothetical protein DRP53_10750 [candidate division WOR-3 bacterium]